MKKLIISLLTLVSFQAFAEEAFYLFNPSSSIPENLESAIYDIPEGLSSKHNIRVLIYPHTLKSDWRHGGPDDPTRFKIIKPEGVKLTDANGSIYDITEATLIKSSNGVTLHFANETKSLKTPITFGSSTPVRIERFGNEDKSHSYTGSFKIGKNSKGLYIVNTVDIETYLQGVVPSESMPSWPLESLKAQTLAARSYAIFHLINGFRNPNWDVDDTARYQVYSGVDHRKPSTDLAISQTEGEVITHNDKIIIAYFHAFSGGYTDSAKRIFRTEESPYCKGDKEIFDNSELLAELPDRNHWIVEWKKDWKKTEVLRTLKNDSDTAHLFKYFNEKKTFDLKVLSRHDNNYNSINEMQITQGKRKVTIDFKLLRSGLGWSNFNSYHFFIKNQDKQNIGFRGFGWGHHLGLSQWGAFMMSKHYGSDYRDIIYHYYADTLIKKL